MNSRTISIIIILSISTLLVPMALNINEVGTASPTVAARESPSTGFSSSAMIAMALINTEIGGNDTLTISDGYYVLNETITLRENATLIVRNAELRFNSSSSTILQLYDYSTVIMTNSSMSHFYGYFYVDSYDNASLSLSDSFFIASSYFYVYENSVLRTFNSTLYSLRAYDTAKAFLEDSTVSYMYIYESSNIYAQDSRITDRITVDFEENTSISIVFPHGYIDHWNLLADSVVTTCYINLTLIGSRVNTWSFSASDTSIVTVQDSIIDSCSVYNNCTVTMVSCRVNNVYAYYAANLRLIDCAVVNRIYLEFWYESKATLILRSGHVDFWNLYTDSLVEKAYFNVTLQNCNVTNWAFAAYNSTISFINQSFDYFYLYSDTKLTMKNSTCNSLYAYESSRAEIALSTVSYFSLYDTSTAFAERCKFGTLGADDNSTLSVIGCETDYLSDNDYASVTVADSTILYRIQLTFISDSSVSMYSLPQGVVDYWNIFENASATTVYLNLTIINSKVRGWGSFYVYDDSQLAVINSILDGIYCYSNSLVNVVDTFVDYIGAYDYSNVSIFGSVVTYELVFSLKDDTALSLTSLVPGRIDYWNLFENATVGKAYVNHTISNSRIASLSMSLYDSSVVEVAKSVLQSFNCYGNSVGTLENCTAYYSYAYGNSILSLVASTVRYFYAYDESISTMTDSEIQYRLQVKFIERSNVTLTSLPAGVLDYWSLTQDGMVTRAYLSLKIFNTKVKAWSCYTYGFSSISIVNSALERVQAYENSAVLLLNCTLDYVYAYRLARVTLTDYLSARSSVGYLYANDASTTIIVRSGIGILYAYSDSYVELTGSMYGLIRVYDRAIVQVGWFLEVHVADRNGQDVPSASVTARDQSGTRFFSGSTDSHGLVILALVEKTVDALGSYPAGSYNVTAGYAGHSSTKVVDMTENKQLTMPLDFIIPEYLPTIMTLIAMVTTLAALMVLKLKVQGKKAPMVD